MQLFVYLFAPIAHMLKESDFQNIRLENGLKMWQGMWEYRAPNAPCFTAPVKPKARNFLNSVSTTPSVEVFSPSNNLHQASPHTRMQNHLSIILQKNRKLRSTESTHLQVSRFPKLLNMTTSCPTYRHRRTPYFPKPYLRKRLALKRRESLFFSCPWVVIWRIHRSILRMPVCCINPLVGKQRSRCLSAEENDQIK